MTKLIFVDNISDKNYAHNNNININDFLDGLDATICNIESFSHNIYGKALNITINTNIKDNNNKDITISKMFNIQKIIDMGKIPKNTEIGKLLWFFNIDDLDNIHILKNKRIKIIPSYQLNKEREYRKDNDGNIFITFTIAEIYKEKSFGENGTQETILKEMPKTEYRRQICDVCKRFIKSDIDNDKATLIKLEHLKSDCKLHLLEWGWINERNAKNNKGYDRFRHISN